MKYGYALSQTDVTAYYQPVIFYFLAVTSASDMTQYLSFLTLFPDPSILSCRWYRCPELLLAPNRPYNEAIDMWAVGCILAELLRRKPLFPGKSHANQVQLIFEVIGYSASQNLGFEVRIACN